MDSLTTREAIRLVAERLTDELVVCTTGYTCRDMQAVCDRPGNFYMIGSMGLASSIGLGVALAKPCTRVVIFDGDGALLMGLGNLSMIGGLAPRNLIHLVFDNEVFASTGRQPTYSASVPLDRMAAAAGYAVVLRAESPDQLTGGWEKIRTGNGPSFLLVKCHPDEGRPMERVRLAPEAITNQFMRTVRP